MGHLLGLHIQVLYNQLAAWALCVCVCMCVCLFVGWFVCAHACACCVFVSVCVCLSVVRKFKMGYS